MATLNSMLIPTTISNTMEYRYTPGQDVERFAGVVIDQDAREIWRSPVWRDTRALAEIDAQEAVDCLCYERRHQLPLALSA